MNSILIIGGNGFIGKNLIDRLIVEGKTIVLLLRNVSQLDPKFQNHSQIKIIEGQLSDIDLIKSSLIELKVDLVIHLASALIPSSTKSDFQLEIQKVIQPTFKLIDLLSELKTMIIFFSSGGTVYGKSQILLDEVSRVEPVNFYGYSKLMIEQYLLFKSRINGLNYLILRPSNVFGKYQRLSGKQGFIAVAINKMLKGEEIEIWGDGKTVRDYINVSDVIDVLLKLISLGISNDIINVGSGQGFNQLEILGLIEKNLKRETKIVFKEKRSVDVDYMVLNINKLQTYLKFYPQQINEGIKLFIDTLGINGK